MGKGSIPRQADELPKPFNSRVSKAYTRKVTPPIRLSGVMLYAPAALYEQAMRRGEGQVTSTGAFAVVTGTHTGRSAADKFVVLGSETGDTVWWDNAKAVTPEQCDTLPKDFLEHASHKNLFAGAAEAHRIGVRVYCEYAWHALFIGHRLLVRRPGPAARPDGRGQLQEVRGSCRRRRNSHGASLARSVASPPELQANDKVAEARSRPAAMKFPECVRKSVKRFSDKTHQRAISRF